MVKQLKYIPKLNLEKEWGKSRSFLFLIDKSLC